MSGNKGQKGKMLGCLEWAFRGYNTVHYKVVVKLINFAQTYF